MSLSSFWTIDADGFVDSDHFKKWPVMHSFDGVFVVTMNHFLNK